MSVVLKTLAAALLLGGSAMVMAANDGQARVNELLSSDPQYRETWEGVVKKEERLPEWVMNLSGAPDQTPPSPNTYIPPLCFFFTSMFSTPTLTILSSIYTTLPKPGS
jgi:hypothetical protein